MSVKWIHLVWTKALDVDENRLLVLLALADWANDEGECWPHMQTLADKTRIAQSTARSCVRWLEDRGYVTTQPGRGRGRRNHYQLSVPPPDDAKPPDKGGFSTKLPGNSPFSGPENHRVRPPKTTGQHPENHRVRPPKTTGTQARATHDTSLTVIKEPSENRAHVSSVDEWQSCRTPGCIVLTNQASGLCFVCERSKRRGLTPMYPHISRSPK